MTQAFQQAGGNTAATEEKNTVEDRPLGFWMWGNSPAEKDEASEESLSAEEKQRRLRAEELDRDDVKQERKSGTNARAGFQSAAAPEEAEDEGGGDLDLTGKFWMRKKWLKNPAKFAKLITPRLDGIIEKAIDNEWKYIAVSRFGKIDPTLATLLKNRVVALSVENKASEKALIKMGYDTVEERREVRHALQHMVVLNETFSMKNFHKLGKSGEEAAVPASAVATAGPVRSPDDGESASRAGLRRPSTPLSA